jgi:isopentenyl-diphosphate delta-isomerase type 1
MLTNPDNPTVLLVDEEDNPIGSIEKLAAHEQGLCHRAFSVFIFRKKGGEWECLLQLWTNTCCSHPKPTELIANAARDRLQEEMGFSVPLEFVDKFHYIADCGNGLIENEIDHVFVGFFTADCRININPQEVAHYAWVKIPQLKAELKANPQHYTPWLARALEKALQKIVPL